MRELVADKLGSSGRIRIIKLLVNIAIQIGNDRFDAFHPAIETE